MKPSKCIECGAQCTGGAQRCRACYRLLRNQHIPAIPPPNPTGLCQCGCGQKTTVWQVSEARDGRVKGQSARFITGHQSLKPFAIPPNVSGLCLCGCGEKTPLATRTNSRAGKIKGLPVRYILGHKRRITEEYEVDPVTQCWNWNGSLNKGGYGRATVNGVRTPAHRYMWEKLRGPIPEGLHIDHLCRNTSCVNPDHLEPVTNAENARRGERAKLTHEAAQAIRQMAGTVPCKEIASRFGVAERTVRSVIQGKTWN